MSKEERGDELGDALSSEELERVYKLGKKGLREQQFYVSLFYGMFVICLCAGIYGESNGALIAAVIVILPCAAVLHVGARKMAAVRIRRVDNSSFEVSGKVYSHDDVKGFRTRDHLQTRRGWLMGKDNKCIVQIHESFEHFDDLLLWFRSDFRELG